MFVLLLAEPVSSKNDFGSSRDFFFGRNFFFTSVCSVLFVKNYILLKNAAGLKAKFLIVFVTFCGFLSRTL